jgi:hypothetical protein
LHKKTALAGGFRKRISSQAFLDFAFAAACFLFKYAVRRFRFCALLDCCPIGFFTLPERFRGLNNYDD